MLVTTAKKIIIESFGGEKISVQRKHNEKLTPSTNILQTVSPTTIVIVLVPVRRARHLPISILQPNVVHNFPKRRRRLYFATTTPKHSRMQSERLTLVEFLLLCG